MENNIKCGTSLLAQWELRAASADMQGVQVRSHMLHGVTEKRKKNMKFIILTSVTMICVYSSVVLLLLLSRFSRVRLCATPQTAAHQAPPSLGFSRQEPWSGSPFPSPMHEREK